MFKIAEGQGGCTPNESQALFLKACLAPPYMAGWLWQKWKKTNSLEVIDEALFRQLPLLHYSLSRARFDGPEMPILKGVARRTWFMNQTVFRRSRELIEAFVENNITSIPLKGLALGPRYYPAAELRSMNDGDIMVRHSDVDRAISLMLRRGWRPLFPMPDGYIKKWHGCTFINAQNDEVDLHWDLFAGYRRNAELWERSVAGDFQGVFVRYLTPTDNLIHVCLHGYRWNPLHPLRWVTDAMMILRKEREQIDWCLLVQEVTSQQMTLRARKCLSYLKKAFKAPIPASVFKKLDVFPISNREEQECLVLTREVPVKKAA